MKTFTQFNETIGRITTTSDVNPGNAVTLGVMNHYTPIENIVTNIRNLFSPIIGIVACVGEDGVSVKLHSTKFVNKEEISKVLYQPVYNHLCVKDYIMQQGLDLIKMINLGVYWVVYFCPRDLPQANPAEVPAIENPCPGAACSEQVTFEAEMDSFITEADDDEEMEDETKKKLFDLFKSKDKVKAAKQVELIVGQQMELPREYYFAGVKSNSGDETIALRWKYTKRTGPKQTSEITKSLMNIYGTGDGAIFISDFDKGSLFNLPPEIKKLIENLLEMFGAEKTTDKAVFNLPDGAENDEDTADNKDEDTSDEDSQDTSKSKSEDDDDTRNDKSDDLLS